MHDATGQTRTRAITEAVTRVLHESSVAVLATLVEGAQGVGAKLLVEESGARAGGLGHPALDAAAAQHARDFLASRVEATTLRVKELTGELEAWGEARVLFERIEPEPRLVICGAGHVGAHLAELARYVGYRATLIDDRADFLTRARFPDEGIELVLAESWTEAVRASIGRGRGVSVAVVTRGHNEDEECMRAVINARPDYVGLIGSRRRTNIVLNRLREAGATTEQLKEVRAPIGLDIAAVSPQEVALAILAEIVSERRGGTGLPLSKWRREQRG
jgi:xanthine dehydrogenase accessory factor